MQLAQALLKKKKTHTNTTKASVLLCKTNWLGEQRMGSESENNGTTKQVVTGAKQKVRTSKGTTVSNDGKS